MKKGDKSGQFYLLAAIVIIVLIAGFVVINNYSKIKDNPKIYELAEELEIESSKFMDYSAFGGTYEWDIFSKNFSTYVGKDVEITYIVGNKSNYYAFYYDEEGNKQNAIFSFSDLVLTVTLNSIDYHFNFKEGENFYFIMYQNISGEYYVKTN